MLYEIEESLRFRSSSWMYSCLERKEVYQDEWPGRSIDRRMEIQWKRQRDLKSIQPMYGNSEYVTARTIDDEVAWLCVPCKMWEKARTIAFKNSSKDGLSVHVTIRRSSHGNKNRTNTGLTNMMYYWSSTVSCRCPLYRDNDSDLWQEMLALAMKNGIGLSIHFWIRVTPGYIYVAIFQGRELGSKKGPTISICAYGVSRYERVRIAFTYIVMARI